MTTVNEGQPPSRSVWVDVDGGKPGSTRRSSARRVDCLVALVPFEDGAGRSRAQPSRVWEDDLGWRRSPRMEYTAGPRPPEPLCCWIRAVATLVLGGLPDGDKMHLAGANVDPARTGLGPTPPASRTARRRAFRSCRRSPAERASLWSRVAAPPGQGRRFAPAPDPELGATTTARLVWILASHLRTSRCTRDRGGCPVGPYFG